MSALPFKTFGKIPRLRRLDMILTEKIDGTNACVVVNEDGVVSAQSRTRVITPGDDNYGFAAWVEQHAEELAHLGPGYHFGEWYGSKIQRGYGLTDRRFALFNVSRWADPEQRPSCCEVVPTLHEGPFDLGVIWGVEENLKAFGSLVNPGFESEGMMIFLSPLNVYLKNPLDPNPKGATS